MSSNRALSQEEKENLSRKLKEYFLHNSHPNLGKPLSEETKEKISKTIKEYYKHHTNSRLGKKHSQEAKIKMSLYHKGKILSEEHKKKIGEASRRWHKQVGFSKETIVKMVNSRRGFKHSQETKKRISEANKGNKAWNKGLTKENDSRVKIYSEKAAESLRESYAKGMIKPSMLGKSHSKETRLKISLSRKGKTYEELMGKEKALIFKKRLSELGKRFKGQNNPMYGRAGNKNPHFGKPAQHGKHLFKRDLNHYCRSNWEANYARYLLFLGKQYQYEAKTFIINLPEGTKGTYTPDFFVDGKEWHELKGWETRNEVKKWELFKQQYPDEKLVFIDRNKYKSIEKMYKYIIPGWEF